MGQFSLLLVTSAFLVCALMVYNTDRSAMRASEKVWEHQHHILARDIASTGMAAAVRTLSTNLDQDWSPLASTLNAMSEEPYNGGTYTVEAFSDQCSLLSDTAQEKIVSRYWPSGTFSGTHDLVEVRSTGTHAQAVGADAEQSHQIVACYLRADWFHPVVPAFQYAFISGGDFTFNGGPDITSHHLEGNGNVHSNQQMTLKPNVYIQGHATMVDEAGSSNQSDDVLSFGYGPEVPIVGFDINAFRDRNGIPDGGASESIDAYKYSAGTDGKVTIKTDVEYRPPGGGQRAQNPWIWFVDGDLEISGGAHLRLPQWTIVVVNGTLNVEGSSNVTVTGETIGENPSDDEARAWVQSQLLDGEHASIAWYVNGKLSTPDDVTISGDSGVIGNIYTNGGFRLDGGGKGMNLVGNVTANTGIVANGGGNGNNFWFVEIGEQNIIPEVRLPGSQVVRMALAEWTDPVLAD